MSKYEVIIRDKPTGNIWTVFFQARNFGHAEEQAWDIIKRHDEIITIKKEW